jgi:GTP cyclohydrolase III
VISCVPSIRLAISGPVRPPHTTAMARHTTRSGQKTVTPKSKMKAVQHLRQSQEYTAISHMDLTSTLTVKLFRKTQASETNINHVKQTCSAFQIMMAHGAMHLCSMKIIRLIRTLCHMAKPIKGACSTSMLRKLSLKVGVHRKCNQIFNTLFGIMCQPLSIICLASIVGIWSSISTFLVWNRPF